MTRYPVIKKLL